MMSLLEYANDVNKSTEDIMLLCKELKIKYTDEESMLTEEDIILLDGELDTLSDDYNDDEILEDRVEQILTDSKIDADNTTKKEKLKSKSERSEAVKNKFQKDRKELYRHREKLMADNEEKENVIFYIKDMTVTSLAEVLNTTSTDIIKKLMKLGVMANINYSLSFELVELLALDYDKEVKKSETKDITNFEKYEASDNAENLVSRPAIVTIMGHVDHGKTSLLDKIRETDIVSCEIGGITQAIGAYQVVCNSSKITFIDTPGHEAFTEMRARGASVTDIVIIIVAADDGVKPQTKEAIDHAKAANVPILVAINKIDKPDANVELVKKELADYGLVPEEWGGDIVFNEISCKTGVNIDKLLESIILVSEISELRANPSRYAMGTVIESRLDKRTGIVATILVQNGTLRIGDPLVVGTGFAKIRTLKNDKNVEITEAYPSMPVEINGLTVLPEAGDKFMAFETEKQAKAIAAKRASRVKTKDSNRSGMTFDDLFGSVKPGVKEVNIVLKADVNGSLEAIKQSLSKIEVEGAKLTVIRGSVGAITESDVVLANASSAIIIGFNIKPTGSVTDLAKEYNVDIKTYGVIYQILEDLEKYMKGILDPEYEEVITGTAEIRQIFKFSKVGLIAGSHVLSGTIRIGSKARVKRGDEEVILTKIKTLQREKDQVRDVKKGMDCGITLEGFQDLRENDIIETFDLVEKKII